jgi:hypothetical protein
MGDYLNKNIKIFVSRKLIIVVFYHYLIRIDKKRNLGPFLAYNLTKQQQWQRKSYFLWYC